MPRFNGISKKYGNNAVFENFSLDIAEGKTTAVLGSSGVGKTTLLNILAGICQCDGEVIAERPTSYVFQTPRLIENLTVKQNISYVMKDRGIKPEEYLPRMQESLELAGIAHKADELAKALSGGEKQRVSLVRAFMFPSKLLLLDEPFSSLDIALKMRIMNLYKDLLSKSPRTVVFVTHNIDEALSIADDFIVLGKNSVLCSQSLSHCNGLRDVTDNEATSVRTVLYHALTMQC